MRRLKLTRINPISAFRVGMGVGVVVGAIAAVIYIFTAFIGGIASKGLLGGLGGGIVGIFLGILLGLFYMVMTGIGVWLFALVYNLAAKYVGALEIELSND